MNSRFRIAGPFAAVFTLFLAGCGAKLPSYYDDLDYHTASGRSRKAGKVDGFYVTNRTYLKTTNPEAYDRTRDAAAELHYGTCDVKLPLVHTIGSDVVSQQLSRVWERPQPGYFSVQKTVQAVAGGRTTAADAFFADVSAALGRPDGDLLILVHGYNNSFQGPVARAAELAHDLGGGIVPVAYCWSSQGEAQGYPHDENDVDFAGRQLAAFLEQVRTKMPAARVHLVAHSMGSRVTTQALARLKGPFTKKPFENLIFAAADIDAAEFKARMVTDGLKDLAARTTLYVAWNDRALEASEYLHGRTYPRAGRAGASILVADGIDTVDVSLNDASIVGHSYYGDNRAVIQDLFLLILHRLPPQERNLYYVDVGPQRYWMIRP